VILSGLGLGGLEGAMRDLFWLSDDAWAALEPHLPHNQPGKPRVDDRRVISGILHILKTGGRWRDVPPEYGPAKTIYNRYTRWARRGVWQRIFAKVAAAGPVPDELALDSSHVKAHRSAAGGKGGSSARRSASRAAAEQRRSIVWPILVAGSSRSR
jgi:transposase